MDPDGAENIVIAGGQYDEAPGNKLMFVHQALRQLKRYGTTESDESRTLVLFDEGYTKGQIRKIQRAAAKYGAAIVRVNNSQELVNYLNSGQTKNDYYYAQGRADDPVTNVDIYAHGHVGSIDFGFKQPNAEQAKFEKSEVE